MNPRPVTCFEITIKLSDPSPFFGIRAGDSFRQARAKDPQFTCGDNPTPQLWEQLLGKLADAILNEKQSIPLTIDTDGQTIIEDPKPAEIMDATETISKKKKPANDKKK